MTMNDVEIKIDNVTISNCSTLEVGWEQVDLDSGRNSQGLMIRNLKRFRVYTLTLNFDNRSIESIKQVSDQIMNKTAFNVTFWSPYQDAKITIPMYFAGSSSTVKNYDIDVEPGKNGWLTETSFEFVQM